MTADSSVLVVNQITALIRSCLPKWLGAGTVLASTVPGLRKRKWSFFIRYPVYGPKGTPSALLVKVPRLEKMTTLEQAASARELLLTTKLEYEALATVWTTFQHETLHPYRAVRPVAFLPEWNAIVMEELPSTPIKRRLLRPGMLLGWEREWKEFEAIIAQAGRWLRIFHERVGKMESEPIRRDRLEQEIATALRLLHETSEHQVNIGPMELAFFNSLQGIGPGPVPTANLHTDLNCANIFTTPDRRLGVWDVGAYVRGPVYADLAVLICDPHIRLLQVLSKGRAFNPRRLVEYRAAVLSGYFGSEPHDENLLNLYCALATVRKWTLDERELAAASHPLRHLGRWVAPYFRRYLFSQLARYIGIRALGTMKNTGSLIQDGNQTDYTEI